MENLMVSTDKKRQRTKKRTKITSRLIYGALLLTPLGVTLLIMRWLFGWVANLIRPIVVVILKGLSYIPVIDSIPQIPTAICVTVVTIIVLLFFVYLVGAIGQRVVGKRLLKAGETLLLRIPLVKTIYSATKQVIEAISMPDKAAFKSVVIVEFPRPGFKAIGFLTGHIQGIEGETLYKVFIPTTPNPTTGFFEIIPPDEVIETNLTVEDAFKMIISGGMVSPDTLEALGTSKSTNNSKQTDKPYAKSNLT
jgi:uncharacterized membrane protein